MTDADARRRADALYMDLALALARARTGRTAPNPAVGCVLVRDGRILATGATADGGRPHAERVALEAAGEAARGATAYVTLEPCAFEGQSGACSRRLTEAGVARVVTACRDEHPDVAGAGLQALQAAGIAIEEGLRSNEARRLYEGFFHRLRTGRPCVYADDRASRYDAVLDPTDPRETGVLLDALGAAGVNRACVVGGSALGRRLAAAGALLRPGAVGDTPY